VVSPTAVIEAAERRDAHGFLHLRRLGIEASVGERTEDK
jgi:hypothetical protein